LHGIQYVSRIDIKDRGIPRDRAGPLNVEIGLRLIVRTHAGVAQIRYQDDLRILRWKAEVAAKLLNIGKVDSRLPHDCDLLAVAVEAGIVKRLYTIDSCDVVRREIMIAAAGGVLRDRLAPGSLRLHAEIVEAVDGLNDRGQSFRNRRPFCVGKVDLPIHEKI